jgi:hypothetical protein
MCFKACNFLVEATIGPINPAAEVVSEARGSPACGTALCGLVGVRAEQEVLVCFFHIIRVTTDPWPRFRTHKTNMESWGAALPKPSQRSAMQPHAPAPLPPLRLPSSHGTPTFLPGIISCF